MGRSGPFSLRTERVAVDPGHQNIAKGLCLFEITEMANVEKVETAVGKNDPFPFGLCFLKDLPQLLSSL